MFAIEIHGRECYASRPEVEVLLGCARTHVRPAATQRILQVLQAKMDWEYLIQESVSHGIAPLVFRNLSRVCPIEISESRLKPLANAASFIASRNLSLTGELVNLLKLFGDIGIRALPIKGPALAFTVYGDLSFRQFSDLDILVDKSDMLRAKEALLTLGYSPKYRLAAKEEKTYLDSHHDYKFVRSGDGSIVDIQWGVTQWSFVFPFDFGELWKNREVISMAGVSVPTPSAEDLLLILCVHGTKHYWEQLKWICDVAELVNTSREKVDWARLLNRSRAVGGERMLLLGLSLSHDLLGACLPDELMTRIRKNCRVKSLARQVIGRLFDDRVKADRLLEERPFFLCLARERWRDKVAIVLRYLPDYLRRVLVPNDRDEAFLQLPRYLSLGYYLVRPVRLVKAYWSESNGRSVRARK